MFEQANLRGGRSALVDWILRGVIAVAFVLFGAEKLPSDPTSPWVVLFARVGLGQWFRYFTGIVEIAGGVLVLIPWTVTLGLALLACTMLGAVLILIFVLGQPADTIMSGGIVIGLLVFWRSRRTG